MIVVEGINQRIHEMNRLFLSCTNHTNEEDSLSIGMICRPGGINKNSKRFNKVRGLNYIRFH